MSQLEDDFAFQLSTILVNPAREYKSIEGRKFRWDFAIPDKKLLIEIQGGTWSTGKMAHNSGKGNYHDPQKHHNLSSPIIGRLYRVLPDCGRNFTRHTLR